MSALQELLNLCRERGMDTDAIEAVKQEVIACGAVARVHHEDVAGSLLNVLAAYDASVSKIKPITPSSIEKNFIPQDNESSHRHGLVKNLRVSPLISPKGRYIRRGNNASG